MNFFKTSKYKYLFLSIVIVFLLSITACGKNSNTMIASYNFSLFNETFIGNYQGELSKHLPNGEGTFTTSEEYNPSFSVTGTWQNGLLNSKATIMYSDGTSISAKFQEGSIQGYVTKTFTDNSYQKYKCASGDPYGLITNYSKDGEILSYDWFYQSEPISSLKVSAKAPNYADLIYNPTLYYGVPILIDGTVVHIYDSSSKSYCILKDKKDNIYIFSYSNTIPAKYSQARTPNLMIGDKITAYGYLNSSFNVSIDKLDVSKLAIENLEDGNSLKDLFTSPDFVSQMPNYSSSSDTEDIELEYSEEEFDNNSTSNNNGSNDEEDRNKKNSRGSSSISSNTLMLETSFPYFSLIAADLKKEPSFNRLNPSFSYEDINRNTFLYAGLKHEFTGQIINLNVDYEKDFIEMLVCESNTNQIYFCTYFFKDSDTYPIIGDNVTISGTLKGNYKIYHTESTELMSYSNNNYYTIYPRLLASKIKIK